MANIKIAPLVKMARTTEFAVYLAKTETDKEIHYFNYIVEELLPNVDSNKDTDLLDAFVSSLNSLKGDGTS